MNSQYSSYIKALEMKGLVEPDCAMCNEVFYPKLKEGVKMMDIFAPRHKASENCKSGKHDHCTCDTCF